MRRLFVVGIGVFALMGGPALAGPAMAAGTSDPALTGSWSPTFQEPSGNYYTVAADTSGGYKPGDSPNTAISSDYCSKPDAKGQVACKPAGVSVSVLPDGRVLYWDGLSGLENIQHATAAEAGGVSTNSQARVLDLRSGKAVFSPQPLGNMQSHLTNGQYGPLGAPPAPVDQPQADKAASTDLFCSDLVHLADGRLLIAGGTDWYAQPYAGNVAGMDLGVVELEGQKLTRFFNPANNTFTQTTDMNYGRWYPGLIELGNGNVFVGGGVRRLITTDGVNVRQTETFDVITNRWSVNGPPATSGDTSNLTNSGNAALPLFPRFNLLPDGTIYYGGVGQMWGPFGQSADEALYNLHSTYDPRTQTWTSYGIGTFGARSGAFSVLLPLKAPYTTATVLVGGGTLGSPPGSYVANNFSETTTFSFNNTRTAPTGAPAFAVGPMLQNQRWYSSTVTLPNDAVAVFNGANKDEVVVPGTESPVRMAEWYTPWDNQFHNLSAAARDRTYHNTAILLPDASVLVGGHAPIAAGYGNYSNQALAADGGLTANNFRDPSFEIYSPPYLHAGPRPEIERVQKGIAWGHAFNIDTPNAKSITSVKLITLPAETHIVDGNMRSVELQVTKRGDNEIQVMAPPSGNIAPPGYYYLFINTGKDATTVPSTAAIVQLGKPQSGEAPLPMKGESERNSDARGATVRSASTGAAASAATSGSSPTRQSAPVAETATRAAGALKGLPASALGVGSAGLGLGVVAAAFAARRRYRKRS